MTYREGLSRLTVAISVSESADMPVLGLSDEHLRDAMAEIARHLLALGARLTYGGDLRQHGFTELLFELIARHQRDADEGDNRTSVIDYLAWPAHISQTIADLERFNSELAGSASLVLLTLDGHRMSLEERKMLPEAQPSDAQWAEGLTSMRKVMLAESQARIVLGGRTENYKGVMPGVAEEALLSLQARQALFLVGGFGGCTRDIAESLGLVAARSASGSNWSMRDAFAAFKGADLNNGLADEENVTLATTPHVDQAVTLILRGLLRAENPGTSTVETA
jgi:hypothetical protein